MTSEILYTALIVATGCERLVELVISKRNAAWSFERGGREYGRGHFPFMVAIHTGLLVGCIAEVWALDRPFVPALGIPMLAVAVACQGIRWHVIRTLGRSWNTRVIVTPGMDRVDDEGLYRWIRHPNYVAVVLEGLALPLIHTAWWTAAIFTVCNAAVLAVRLRVEERALEEWTGAEQEGA
jgi:methyltransferase